MRRIRKPQLTAFTLATWLGITLVAPGVLRSDDVASEQPAYFGFGRSATSEEIAAWDIDVMPDGTGLPAGKGTVAQGAQLYKEQCAVCHGPTGVEGPNDRLVVISRDEPFPDASDADSWQHRTIGNYWPSYSVTAYLLYLNGLVAADITLDATSLPLVKMPARERFVADDRLDYNEVH
jgi:cytochrome c